jgi:hypothetical protein
MARDEEVRSLGKRRDGDTHLMDSQSCALCEFTTTFRIDMPWGGSGPMTPLKLAAVVAVVAVIGYGAYTKDTSEPQSSPAQPVKVDPPKPRVDESPKRQAGLTREELARMIRPIEGDPVEVATRVIGDNFDFKICPAVATAIRLTDKSIQALCVNGEAFRVFSLLTVGDVAMRCSAMPGGKC